jgi:protein-S-isoprenylcysteine O-methyltransferase Ste14
MVTISLGIIGFLLGIVSDVVSLKGPRRSKPFVWLLSSVLLAYAHVAAALSADKFWLPGWAAWPAWSFLIAGALMMFYSFFLEIPFSKTYAETGSSNELVQVGTYALTRHPGALWYAVMLAGLVLASRSWLALWAAPVWLLMEIVWVWTEDRFLFGQMFQGYREYRKTTPMLIPTWASMQRCWRTLPLRRAVRRFIRARTGQEPI